MSTRFRITAKHDRGFTLIELLVVVLIIGILSAIAVPIFLGQQDQAKDASVKADLTNATKAVIGLSFRASGGSITEALEDFGMTKSGSTVELRLRSNFTDWCWEGTSTTTNVYHLVGGSETEGVTAGACTDEYSALVYTY